MWALPKIVIYISEKAQNCKKSCVEKNALHIHMGIFTDAQKVTWEITSDNFRKLLLLIAILF